MYGMPLIISASTASTLLAKSYRTDSPGLGAQAHAFLTMAVSRPRTYGFTL